MLVSVIIPCYNVADYIAECLESVFNQYYKGIEIICVDDSSSDNTYSVLRAYKEKHPSIILLSNQKNKGAPYSRNRGLAHAKGQFIQFLDADDMLLPEKIEHQINLLDNTHPEIGFIAGAYIRKYSNGKEENNIPLKEMWMGLISAELGCTCSNLFLTEAVKNVNGWDETLSGSQETELMFRLLKNGYKVIIDYELLTVVRSIKVDSISNTNLNCYWINYLNLRVRIIEYLQKEERFNDKLKNYSLQAIFDTIRILYVYNKVEAKKYYTQFIHEKYVPTISPATTSMYLFFYQTLGFPAAEKLSGWFRLLKSLN